MSLSLFLCVLARHVRRISSELRDVGTHSSTALSKIRYFKDNPLYTYAIILQANSLLI